MDLGEDVRAFIRYNAFNSWGWLDTVDLITEAVILDVSVEMGEGWVGRDKSEIASRGRATA